MLNIITEEMTRNVYGLETCSHDQVIEEWKRWSESLYKIMQDDGCEFYSDAVDCFWPSFADGYTPQEAWDEEKSYAGDFT